MRYPPWLDSVARRVGISTPTPVGDPSLGAWDEEVQHWIPPALSLERRIPPNDGLVSPQEQSPLFTWLPVEIRLMIYEELFARRTLHMYPVRGDAPGQATFRHHRCSGRADATDAASNPGDVLRACMATATAPPPGGFGSLLWPYPGADMQAGPRLSSRGDAAVLRACRRAYGEGAGLLYRANRFDFAHPQALNWFVGTVPPELLASVSSLQVRLDLDWRTSGEAWCLMWANIVERMPGLEDLLVVVRFTFPGPRFRAQNKVDEKRLLKLSEKCVPAFVCKRHRVEYMLQTD